MRAEVRSGPQWRETGEQKARLANSRPLIKYASRISLSSLLIPSGLICMSTSSLIFAAFGIFAEFDPLTTCQHWHQGRDTEFISNDDSTEGHLRLSVDVMSGYAMSIL